MDNFDIAIIGAGALGLATAYTLARDPRSKIHSRNIVLLEQEASFGQHTSSRNSEVIHAGIYYPYNSLKAKLCVKGKIMLYAHCRQFGIPCRALGKLIIADDAEAGSLEQINANAKNNGVEDLQWLDQSQLRQLEPALRARVGLFSPSSGIIDSHAYLLSLLHGAQANGVEYAAHTRVTRIEACTKGFRVCTEIATAGSVEHYQFHCRQLVNAAGLNAQELAKTITGLDASSIPQLHLCKGDYFTYSGKNPFNHLIYPLPERDNRGLGIHATIDLAGQIKFGPDTEYVGAIDYRVDGSKRDAFASSIRRFFPALESERLVPAYAGIRPKLAGPGQTEADFLIQTGTDNQMPGLIQLFGMESPGLTASLAIAEKLVDLLHQQN
jgi:L-2-hydroxyglutarate oxidase LhgO